MTPSEALQAVCEAWNRLDNDALADLFAETGSFEDPPHERGCAAARTSARSMTRDGRALASARSRSAACPRAAM